MSWNRSAPLIDLDIRPSRRLAVFLIGLHLLAGGAVLASGIAPMLRVSLAAVVAVSLFYRTRRGLLGQGAIQRAVWYPDGEWALVDVRGRSLGAEMLPGVVCLPWLVVVRLKPLRGGWPQTLLLAGDSADKDLMRRLRVRLRLEASLSDPDR